MAGEESYFLTVTEVTHEIDDAVSVEFSVPEGAEAEFAFKPGQFLTLGVPSDETGLAARCYSLCVPPGEALRVAVKRTADGYASNWINDNLAVGDTVRVLPPSGIFSPKSLDDDLLLWAGGSGITPIMSILRTVLRDGTGRVVLFYANRDERSVIFASALAALSLEFPDRLQVVHWLESVQGLPSMEQLRAYASTYDTWTSFCCGPAPFMKAVSDALRSLDFPRERRHQEKFVSLGGNVFGDVEEVQLAARTLAEADDAEHSTAEGGDTVEQSADSVEQSRDHFPGPIAVEAELDGETYSFVDWSGKESLLEFLESKGIEAPYSCRLGQCSACACMVLEGEVTLANNEVLDDADLADGIRLACQAHPASEKLRVTYNG